MFEYHNLPYMEEEARAAIWAALCELACLEWREIWLHESDGLTKGSLEEGLSQIEARRDEVSNMLYEYSSQHWLSRGEYLDWWHETVGRTESEICYYCFDR